MKKRILTLALICLMVYLPLVACGESGAFEPDFSEHLEISIATSSHYGNNAMTDFLADKFNVTITVVEESDEALMPRIAAGNAPDVFHKSITSSLYKQMEAAGQLLEVPKSVTDNYPYLTEYMQMSTLYNAMYDAKGTSYHIPRLGSADAVKPVMPYGAWWYRADWLENVGMEVPTTMDEVYEVAKAFTLNDPDGNGKNDTYAFTGKLWQFHFSPWVDMYNWTYVDDQWVPGYMADGMLEAMKWWNRMYEEGYLDPEFARSTWRDSFVTGKVGFSHEQPGSYWMTTTFYTNFPAVNPDIDPYEAIQVLAPPAINAGEVGHSLGNVESDSTLFSYNCTPEKMERIVAIYDWRLSPEGRDWFFYGFEGEDWEIEDGKGVNLLPVDENTGRPGYLWNKYDFAFGNETTWAANPHTPEADPIYPVELTEWVDVTFQELYGKNIWPYYSDVEIIASELMGSFEYGFGEIEDKANELIAGPSATLEANWNEYIDMLLNVYGLQDIIDAVTAQAAAEGVTP